VISRGPVSTAASQHSLVLATGDVTSGDDIQFSVVICDGDVHVKRNVTKSLIIARGKITIGGTAYRSNLYAGQTVAIAKPREVTMSPQAEKVFYVVVKEHETNPLGYITFFELSTVGVEVKVADGAVAVAKVAEGKPFAKAGVKVGDVVTAVNGKKPDSAESLRRLLRDALALGDATVTLKRGDKTETVKVSLPE
jgi:membrane-associated protease RseP (regulator of RpoE activity)